DQGWYPEAAQPGEGRVGVGSRGRGDVVVEAAPLVECDDQYGPAPHRAAGDRLVDRVEEGVTVAYVPVRVVIAGQAVDGLEEQWRLHVRHGGQVAAGRIAEERVPGPADAGVLEPPEGEEGQVVVVVRAGDAGLRQPVPDGRHRGKPEAVVDPVGLCGVQVQPVWDGGPESGGEVVVAYRPHRRGRAGER